ncbi:hypothetical protein QR680_018528 [Steinernema hermaphroditum]|uniref:Uncharacterized protein n=1 Tax=Steinernema hermaphroditum TaxID=289476 RepID=A0AA39HJH0_9BILA|nr:hypothetical protein QR680_018528 [Steinernema hermaphroditum]
MYSAPGFWRALHHNISEQRKESFVVQRIVRVLFGFPGRKSSRGHLTEKRVRFKKQPEVHEIPAFPWDEFPPFSQEEIAENLETVRMEKTIQAMEALDGRDSENQIVW